LGKESFFLQKGRRAALGHKERVHWSAGTGSGAGDMDADIEKSPARKEIGDAASSQERGLDEKGAANSLDSRDTTSKEEIGNFQQNPETHGIVNNAPIPAGATNFQNTLLRPQASQDAISASSSRAPPSLTRREARLATKEAHPWQHIGLTLGLPMILLFDVVVPCIIYYGWYDSQRAIWQTKCKEQFLGVQPCPLNRPEFDKKVLGSAIASFGIGELWILIARVWRLFFHADQCAPLLSRSRYELDATSWVYFVAMLLALIPFVVGSSMEQPHLYLYGPSFIMGFLGSLMIITLWVPLRFPIGINSHARGTRLRPFMYYAAEDFIAVDGLQDREFRIRYNERYETNSMFRQFFVHLTMWWLFGVCVYIGCVSAVIWTLPFHQAFGLSLGVLFSYIAIWAAVTNVWLTIEMKREDRAYQEGRIHD
jgi:hypothetical protein